MSKCERKLKRDCAAPCTWIASLPRRNKCTMPPQKADIAIDELERKIESQQKEITSLRVKFAAQVATNESLVEDVASLESDITLLQKKLKDCNDGVLLRDKYPNVMKKRNARPWWPH